MAGPIDLSDYLVEIDVLSRVLQFLRPDESWGWQHPKLIAFMQQHGFTRREALGEAELEVIVASLNKALSRELGILKTKNR